MLKRGKYFLDKQFLIGGNLLIPRPKYEHFKFSTFKIMKGNGTSYHNIITMVVASEKRVNKR